MARKRYQALYPREFTTKEGEKRTQFMVIGTAFEGANGGFDAILHVLPPFTHNVDRAGNVEASPTCRIVFREPRDFDEQQNGAQGAQRGNGGGNRRAQGGAFRGGQRDGHGAPSFDPDEPMPDDDGPSF